MSWANLVKKDSVEHVNIGKISHKKSLINSHKKSSNINIPRNVVVNKLTEEKQLDSMYKYYDDCTFEENNHFIYLNSANTFNFFINYKKEREFTDDSASTDDSHYYSD